MYSVICALQLTFFFLFYSLFLHSSFLWTACIHHIYRLSSLLFLPDGFLKFLPSLLFTTCTIVQQFFFFLLLKTSFVFLPPHSHCVSAQSFKSRHVWKTHLELRCCCFAAAMRERNADMERWYITSNLSASTQKNTVLKGLIILSVSIQYVCVCFKEFRSAVITGLFFQQAPACIGRDCICLRGAFFWL